MTTISPALWGPRPDRLVAYWSMDSDFVDGSTVIDHTMNNHNADASGGGIFSDTGWSKEAIYFDGTNGATIAPMGLGGDQSVTISAWVNVDSGASASNVIFSFGTRGSANNICFLRTAGNGTFKFAFWSNDLNANCPNYYGSWTHVAAVYDALGDDRRIYVDGVEQGSDTPSNNGTPSFDNVNYEIGVSQDTEHMEGSIDELRVYDYPLVGAQIHKLANQTSI